MDIVVEYATPEQVLAKLHKLNNQAHSSESVPASTAIEAIKAYHKQFLEAVPTSALESKILKAKRLGIRFIKASPTGQYQETPDAVIVTEGLTTEGFEEILNKKIDYYNDRLFIDILKKHDLLK